MNKPLYQQIFNQITKDIMTGSLMPGDKVPSEKELSDHHQVSRITAKKALDLLASNNTIERIRGKGSYVTEKLTVGNEIASLGRAPLQEHEGLLVGAVFPGYMTGYGLQLQYAIEKKIAEYNGTLIIKRGGGLIEGEEEAISAVMQMGVKGLIAFPVSSEQYNRNLLKLILEGFPTVVVDRDLKGILAGTVTTDNKAAAQELTSFLFDRGHQHVAFLSPPPEITSTVEDRLQGFQQAYLMYGLRLKPEHLITNLTSAPPINWTSEQHRDFVERDVRTLQDFVRDNPEVTAFVTAEYELAVMLTKVLKQLGKRVPEDFSVTCFDCPDDPLDIPWFTHIRQNEHAMGTKAVELLMAQLQSDRVPLQTLLDYQLIVGRSTRSL